MCCAGFLHRFRDLAKMSKRARLTKIELYKDAKLEAKDYTTAKKAFVNNLQNNGFGGWVVNPPEIGAFVK